MSSVPDFARKLTQKSNLQSHISSPHKMSTATHTAIMFMIVYFMYDSNFKKTDKVVPLLNYAMDIDVRVWGSGCIDPLFLNTTLDENGQLYAHTALPP
jgi:hypothetical protein